MTGKLFTNLLEELIFAPLQMARTTFDPTVAMTFPLAQVHHVDAEGGLSVRHWFWDRVAGYPSGGAFSTVLDLANFAILHLCEGEFRGKQILSAASVREMQTPHAVADKTTARKYGLTFFLDDYKGLRLVEHWGGVGSFSSRFVLAPEIDVGVIVLHNRMESAFDPDGIVASVLELFRR